MNWPQATRPHAVVVGAGPVGAITALLLSRSDIAVTLIERNAKLTTLSRASTFQPSTLDLLASIGVDLLTDPAAVVVEALQWRDNKGELLGEVSYRTISDLTAHPYRIHIDQQSLLDQLAFAIADDPGIDLRTGSRVIDIDSTRPGVVTTEEDGQRLSIAADVVIGCDGARSTIRRLAGIPFRVKEYPTIALRANVLSDLDALLPADAPHPLSALCYFRGSGDGLSALRMNTHTRLIVRATPDDEALARVSEAVAATTPMSVDDLDIRDIDTYRLQRGVVDSYVSDDGAVIVIGDAAHVTSTAGGLNMNSGIHDAFALIPALAEALCGGQTASRVRPLAAARRNFILTEVIPRTERRVRGLQDHDRRSLSAHLSDIAVLSSNTEAARQFLMEASLMDSPRSFDHNGMTQS